MLIKDEIKRLISTQELFSRDYGPDDDLETQAQPASMDITVGDINVPPDPKANDPWETVAVFNDRYDLNPGAVALVRSSERLKMPQNLGGLVFPKNGDFAARGILITNFGHIDPGFEGYLKFTVINMGNKRVELVRRKTIVAGVILFNLSNTTLNHTTERYKPRHAYTPYSLARSLPRDFLDIDARIAGGVKDYVAKEWANRDERNMRIAIMSASVAIVVAIWVGLMSFVSPLYSEVWKLDQKISFIEGKLLK